MSNFWSKGSEASTQFRLITSTSYPPLPALTSLTVKHERQLRQSQVQAGILQQILFSSVVGFPLGGGGESGKGRGIAAPPPPPKKKNS
jgi:hypothetical protein